MNKKVKLVLEVLGLACFVYLLVLGVDELRKSSRRIEADKAQQIIGQRISDANYKLADTFARCAADLLAPQYLEEFITYEVMPLGIAWRLANQKGKPVAYEKVDPLTRQASNRLSDFIFQSLDFSSGLKFKENSQKYSDHLRKKSEGEYSSFDWATYEPYPSSFVYESLNSRLGKGYDKNLNPEDIEIGEKGISWPKFKALAERCNAQPKDLQRLVTDSTPISEMSEKGESISPSMEYEGDDQNPEYTKMKEQFWREFSVTAKYQQKLTKLKNKNADIIHEIIKENEPLVRAREAQQKSVDDVIFNKL